MQPASPITSALLPPYLPMQSQQRDELDEATATGQYITEVALLFVSPDHGVLMQEYQSISATGESKGGGRGMLVQERVSERVNQAAGAAPRADLPSLTPSPSAPALFCPSRQGFVGLQAPHLAPNALRSSALPHTPSFLLPRLPLSSGAKGFVGLQAPHLIMNKPTMATLPSGKMTSSHAARVVMQGFAGMEDNDDKVWGGPAIA